MGSASHVYRRASGIYAVRIFVPRRLWPSVGKREVHVSTRSRDQGVAKVVGLSIALVWKQRFIHLMGIDVDKLLKGSPLLAGGGHLPLLTAATELGMDPQTLLREMVNHRIPLLCWATGWPGYEVQCLDDVETNEDGQRVLNDAPNVGEPTNAFGLIAIDDAESVVEELIRNGTACFSACRARSTGRNIYLLPERDIVLVDVLVDKSELARVHSQYKAELEASVAKASPPFHPSESSSSSPVQQMPGAVTTPGLAQPRYANMRASELLGRFLEEKNDQWKEEQRRRMRTVLQPFVDLMDDPRLADIDRETVMEYRRRLLKLPKDLRAARKANPKASAVVLLEWAEKQTAATMTSKTADLYVRRLSEMFNWALRTHYLSQNPALAVGKRGHIKRAQDDRKAFSDDELRRIFSAPWFLDGHGPRTAKGRFHNYQPHYYWLPLLALYTGARLGELCQLYLDDVGQTASGVAYLHFRLDQPDKLADSDEQDNRGGTTTDKSLKTVNAQREVAIHDVLIHAGLLEYVQALRKAGHQRLFPELTFDPIKGYGKAAGKWFNDRYLGVQLKIPRNSGKSFHSFRHTFITAASHAGLSEQVVAQIVGHARGSTQSMLRYRKDEAADALKKHIDQIQFDIGIITPFNVKTGLSALKDALSRKALAAKRNERNAENDI